ncbi:Holliday junction branch migration protein RuvA [Rhodosalinus sp.]|uniref:Holliday junction branch migration protein RuvA n=1 Tax=Rhodosalinus sp. TaxID=2047741 RepID=UPI0039789C88
MIGRLAGRIEYRAEDHVLIDVRGVGYVVHCSERTLGALPGPGEAVALWTDLLVREDLLQLYGFLTLGEREWHRLLMRVQGVGAKASLAILGALGADGVSRAVALGDWSAIKAAKGIGPKTAQRVVNELRDKAPGVMALDHAGVSEPTAPVAADAAGPAVAPATRPVTSAPARAEALSALGNLGYAPGEAAAAVAEAQHETPEADTAALIRAALGRLAPKG